MSEWWEEDSSSGAQKSAESERHQPAIPTSVPRADANISSSSEAPVAAIGANSIVAGLSAGVLAAALGLGLGAMINSVVLPGSHRYDLAVRTISVATVLGASLAGLTAITAGQILKGLRRATVGGIGAALAAGALLPVVDAVWDASREGTGVGDLRIVVAAWALVGALVGASTGLTDGLHRSRAAMAGGLIGGLAGGLAFVATSHDFDISQRSSALSQILGYSITAIGIGAGVGLAERAVRSAWLQILDGPLAGREIIIYRSRAIIGRNSDSDIYMPGDPRVEPRHAEIRIDEHGMTLVPIDGEVAVDGQPWPGGALSNGSIVKIGSSYLQVNIR